jgi:hypothetical protein
MFPRRRDATHMRRQNCTAKLLLTLNHPVNVYRRTPRETKSTAATLCTRRSELAQPKGRVRIPKRPVRTSALKS